MGGGGCGREGFVSAGFIVVALACDLSNFSACIILVIFLVFVYIVLSSGVYYRFTLCKFSLLL